MISSWAPNHPTTSSNDSLIPPNCPKNPISTLITKLLGDHRSPGWMNRQGLCMWDFTGQIWKVWSSWGQSLCLRDLFQDMGRRNSIASPGMQVHRTTILHVVFVSLCTSACSYLIVCRSVILYVSGLVLVDSQAAMNRLLHHRWRSWPRAMVVLKKYGFYILKGSRMSAIPIQSSLYSRTPAWPAWLFLKIYLRYDISENGGWCLICVWLKNQLPWLEHDRSHCPSHHIASHSPPHQHAGANVCL